MIYYLESTFAANISSLVSPENLIGVALMKLLP